MTRENRERKKKFQDNYKALFSLNPMTKEERRAYYSQTETYKNLQKKVLRKNKPDSDTFEIESDVEESSSMVKLQEIQQSLLDLNPMSREEERAYYSQTDIFKEFQESFNSQMETEMDDNKGKGEQLEIKGEMKRKNFTTSKEALFAINPMTKAERRAYYSQTDVYKEFEKKYKLGNKGLDLEYFNPIIRFLHQSGISSNSYNQKFILRRVKARMLRSNKETLEDYLTLLQTNGEEIKLLKKSLSILVTRFFRDRDTFDYLENMILPNLILENSLKIWSAGCADGAEPYSLAILSKNIKKKFSILATDIKQELLNKANLGFYSSPYLKELSTTEIDMFFNKISDINFEINSTIKKIVSFYLLDLINHKYPRNMDIIFCRNVLIYFDSKMEKIVIDKFHNSLKTGGYLVLGRTEIIDHSFKNKFELISSKHRIYKKIDIFNN